VTSGHTLCSEVLQVYQGGDGVGHPGSPRVVAGLWKGVMGGLFEL
jgi:hypothetical protein